MTLILDITDENGRTIVHEEYADDSQFYVGTIDADGKYASIGRAKPKGKEFIKGIRTSAQKWAQEQDLDGFFEELRKMLVELAIKMGNLQAQTYLEADTFHFDADVLLSILKDVRQYVNNSFKESFGQEGGVVLFHLTWEILLAMIARLKKERRRVQTIWEYSSLPIGKDEVRAVLEWIFRRT